MSPLKLLRLNASNLRYIPTKVNANDLNRILSSLFQNSSAPYSPYSGL